VKRLAVAAGLIVLVGAVGWLLLDWRESPRPLSVAGRSGSLTDQSSRPAVRAIVPRGASDDEPATSARTTVPTEVHRVVVPGVIRGKVTFANAPESMPQQIDMGSRARECGTEGKPVAYEYYVVGADNAAGNVLVYVRSGPATQVKTPVPTADLVFELRNCMYAPHVVGMRAGQAVRFNTSGAVHHNIHLRSQRNGDWNTTMFPNSSLLAGEGHTQRITNPEFPPIALSCDIHTWMRAFVGVFTHDYFRVTREDGAYELAGLPPGDYEIEAWHERAKADPQTVTIASAETKELNFVLKFID
jgi:plastocyanin